MQLLIKLNRIISRKAKVKFFILVLAIIVGAVLETLTVVTISPLIMVLLDSSSVETNQYIKFAYDILKLSNVNTFLALITFFIAGIYILRGVYIFVLTRVQTRFVAKTRLSLSNQLLEKILSYPYLYHTGKNLAELDAIILTDCTHLFAMVNSILSLLTDSFMSFFMLAALFIASPIITLCVLATVLLLVVLYFKFFRNEINTAGVKNRTASIGLKKSINQALGGIKEVKLLKRESYFLSAFKKFTAAIIRINTRYTVLNAIPKLMIESVCFGGAFFIVGAIILTGADMSSIIPQLGIFALAALRIMPAVTRMVNNINVVINNRVFVNSVHKSLFEDDDIVVNALLPEPKIPEDAAGKNITIRNVSFTYPKIPSPVLSDVSLVIPENKSVAFVGASGEGKTTLADIILGVLSPQSGGVFYDGKSIHHNFSWWCENVGYIPQVIYLLDESIIDNIAFGIEREKIDTGKVWHALKQAQLADFVRSLPDGIETTIGDRGIRLSGGQRQRIGIARALYENPSILVLDEATSSLDTETEAAIMEAIRGFHGNKTILIIAHRLSTIEHCDIVYRVEDKKVTRER